MRPVLLVLLVSYHAFAPYCGARPMPDGIYAVDSYKWIALFSRAFRLEAFVFISGYIFTFQLLTQHKFSRACDVALNKMNRLLIPCVFFGVFYYLIFRNCSQINPIGILTGIGHLWYLPCLFWLFIVQYLIIKGKHAIRNSLNGGGKLMVVCVLPFFSILPFPFQLNKALYYFLFFYGGGVFYQYKDEIAKRTSVKTVMAMWLIFVLMTFGVNIAMDFVRDVLYPYNIILMKGFGLIVNLYLKIALAWIGIVALYQTAVLFCRKHNVGRFMLKVGTCGYGVYIFHQFVLIHLYRQTTLPQIVGSIWLPWVSLALTVLVSVALTLLVRQTNIGKKYL